VCLLFFIFICSESFAWNPRSQAGYLAAFGYLFPGDVSNEDAWLKPSDLTAGTAGLGRFDIGIKYQRILLSMIPFSHSI
jgi:hypothetical protein